MELVYHKFAAPIELMAQEQGRRLSVATKVSKGKTAR